MAIDQVDDRLSLVFAALADPTRRAILARLASGDAHVSEIMKPFGLSQPTISKHLKVLELAGLIARGRDAQRRPRALVAAPLKDVDRWLEQYRRFWEARFERLDEYLREVPEPQGQQQQKQRTSRQRTRRGRTNQQ